MSATSLSATAHEPYHAHNPWYFFTTSGDLGFAVRTTAAGVASLLTAMWIQLDVPRWAILTTLLVSPPVRGNALRKSAARLIGTFIGCVVAMILVGLFPQDRVGFILVFALWLGSCAYWATLRRGFVAYAAILAAFTSAIVAANFSDAPQEIFYAATDRGSATVIGILFALLLSESAARSDDVPGDLANRGCQLMVNLLDWAAGQLNSRPKGALEDAPFTAAILGLDELNRNAMAERPALRWVRPWIKGAPTAMLSLQTAVIAAARAPRYDRKHIAQLEKTREAVLAVRNLLTAGARTPLPEIRGLAESLGRLRQELSGNEECCEIISALQFIIVAIDAILTQRQPDYVHVQRYPAARFLPQHARAVTNLKRAIVGIIAGFLIWDATAWPQGSFFLVNVSVALVIYISLDNPLALNFENIIGAATGAVFGLVSGYVLLPWSNHPFWLAAIMFVFMFPGVWAQTKPKLIVPAITYIFVVLTVLDPSNPQQYDLSASMNVALSVVGAYSFVPAIFLLIGAPKTGQERTEELLERMRKHIRLGLKNRHMDRADRLRWETGMYDGLQQLQAETTSPAYRARGVEILMAGRNLIAASAAVS